MRVRPIHSDTLTSHKRNTRRADKTQFISVMLQETLRQMLRRREKKKNSLHTITRQWHTAEIEYLYRKNVIYF